MNPASYENTKSFLYGTDFTNISDYSKNKRHIHGVIGSLSKADRAQIEELLPSLDKALSNLKAAQICIKEQKLDNSKPGVRGFLTRAYVALKHGWYDSTRLTSVTHKLNHLLELKKINFKIALQPQIVRIAEKLQTVGTGATKAGAKVLSDDYWQETIGLNLQIDGKAYSGRIYMGYFSGDQGGASYIAEWKESYQTQYSFEEYMNIVKIPSMDAKEKESLVKACEGIVEYYDLKELEPLTVHFKDGKMMLSNAVLNDWFTQWPKRGEPASGFREFLKGLPPYESREVEISNISDRLMYVLRTDGKLVVQMKQRGKANHTSLTGGHAVIAAGHLFVRDGKIQFIDTMSGHYKPSVTQVMSMLEMLEKNGVALNEIGITYATLPEQAYAKMDIDTVDAGKAKEWMEKQRNILLDRIEKLTPINREQAKIIPYARLEKMLANLQKAPS